MGRAGADLDVVKVVTSQGEKNSSIVKSVTNGQDKENFSKDLLKNLKESRLKLKFEQKHLISRYILPFQRVRFSKFHCFTTSEKVLYSPLY